MAVKKKKKVVAYDPYRPYGGHSLTWYQQQANSRAAADTNAAVGALPSSQFYTDSAVQLANALKGIRGDQAGVAQAGGDMYANAFKAASEPANRAAMAAGGQPVAGPANTSLVGALGATMAQAFSGGEQAAVARGRNDVIARAGQEAAIRAKQSSLSNSYLEKMKEDALQASVAGFNNRLAQSQFGLQASDTAFDNQLNAAQLDASIAGDQASAGAKSQASINKAIAAARKAAREARTGTKSSVTIGNDYTYNIPNSVVTGDPSASGTSPHVVRAKDGPSAQAALHAWIKNLPGFDPAVNANSYYSGQFKAITQEKTTPGSRTAQLHAALDVLMDAGLSRSQALKYARQIIGSKVGTKKKKSTRDPNAGGK
jgi:hypothetical protein